MGTFPSPLPIPPPCGIKICSSDGCRTEEEEFLESGWVGLARSVAGAIMVTALVSTLSPMQIWRERGNE